ncbi:MAG: DUF4389 domain-containing protein [Dehalococcoidales bacterium]|nr:DUF4389 domain-containing protein [Dehalococcoidales bacterium]
MSDSPTPAGSLTAYPASLSVDYPDRNLNRLTSFFRLFTSIPIFIILGLIGMGVSNTGSDADSWFTVMTVGGVLFLPLVLMILFRKKYPRWWFDWNLALTRFTYRCTAYFALLRDEYPSTDEEQSVHLDLVYPDVQNDLGRGWPLIKWFLAIPHYIILCFLGIAAWICVIIAWFAILFTGRYPRGLFDFVVGVGRWGLRVQAYAMILTTDKYPPFTLEG